MFYGFELGSGIDMRDGKIDVDGGMDIFVEKFSF